MIKKISLFIVALIFISLSAGRASAAAFGFGIDKQTFAINEDFSVNLRIDSQGVSVNAAQGTLQFPSDILEVKSIDKESSVFNFWLQEPAVSSGKNSISFTGGSTSGFSGQSLNVFKVLFHVKGSGTGSININDGAITASDGSGTNVLIGGKGIDIISSSGGKVSGTPATITPVIPPITPIVREAVPSGKLPIKPEAAIGLYPNPDSWYNNTAPFLVSWKLPLDVTDIATAINKDPAFTSAKSEGLFDNKTFAPLTDGVWYLHIRFKNNIGWGPVFHYRIAIDTNPPLPFDISSSSGIESDNPSPVLSFATADQSSGIMKYSVQVGVNDSMDVSEGSITLPLQSPGNKKIKVIAFDKAGNSTESSFNLNVVPLVSPTISSITESIVSGDGIFEARGESVPGYSVEVSIKRKDGSFISSKSSVVDEKGNWIVNISDYIPKGSYLAAAVAKDSRGALSLPVIKENILYKEKPLFVIGNWGISATLFYIAIIVIILMGTAGVVLYTRNAGIKRGLKSFITRRDVVNFFISVQKDLEELGKMAEKTGSAKEVIYRINKIKEKAEKSSKYLSEEVEELGKDK